MRYITLIFCLLSLHWGVSAQSLDFDHTKWDFGTIDEMGGEVTHSFTFRNNTAKSVVIHNIRTSCGCTTPTYSRQPIAAGKSSTVEVAFDPRYRPGVFLKDLYIYSTASQEPITLSIKGRVTPRVLPIEEQFPYALGRFVRLDVMYISIAGIEAGELQQSDVTFVNNSERDVKIEFRQRSRTNGLRLFYNRELRGGSVGVVNVGYFIEESLESGSVLNDTVDIFVDGRSVGKSLFIKGVVR